MVRPLRTNARTRWKHALWRFAKGDGDDALPFGHALARTQIERHAGPTPIVDVALQSDERLGVGLRVNAGLRTVANVLSAYDVDGLDRQQAAEHLVLFFTDRIRLE